MILMQLKGDANFAAQQISLYEDLTSLCSSRKKLRDESGDMMLSNEYETLCKGGGGAKAKAVMAALGDNADGATLVSLSRKHPSLRSPPLYPPNLSLFSCPVSLIFSRRPFPGHALLAVRVCTCPRELAHVLVTDAMPCLFRRGFRCARNAVNAGRMLAASCVIRWHTTDIKARTIQYCDARVGA